MRYEKFDKEDFDAIVTGELTHLAVWLESELIEIISDYFLQVSKRLEFQRLLLLRDGLSLQDKIEIVRALLPSFANQTAAAKLRPALVSIEEFKTMRNAFAHGRDVTPPEQKPLTLHVETVSRSGKERVVVITPESHSAVMLAANKLLFDVQQLRGQLYLREVQKDASKA